MTPPKFDLEERLRVVEKESTKIAKDHDRLNAELVITFQRIDRRFEKFDEKFDQSNQIQSQLGESVNDLAKAIRGEDEELGIFKKVNYLWKGAMWLIRLCFAILCFLVTWGFYKYFGS